MGPSSDSGGFDDDNARGYENDDTRTTYLESWHQRAVLPRALHLHAPEARMQGLVRCGIINRFYCMSAESPSLPLRLFRGRAGGVSFDPSPWMGRESSRETGYLIGMLSSIQGSNSQGFNLHFHEPRP